MAYSVDEKTIKRSTRKGYLSCVTLIFTGLIFVQVTGIALEHEVVYMDGYPYKRDSFGDEADLDIGDIVEAGETVVTGSGDYLELEAEGYTVKINEDTVFEILELEEQGQKRDVMSVALGKLSFSGSRLLGTEPRLKTSSAICGVRGTKVVLLAGIDGSSMIIVEEGAVEIEAAGETVLLATGEGVEVETGSAPGEKFKALEREVDYSDWNKSKADAALADPVGAVHKIESQLELYIFEIKKIYPLYLESKQLLEKERANVREVLEKKGKDEASKVYREMVFPLEQDLTFRYVNIRYYALSAFSLRRFVASRLYMTLKAIYITNRLDPIYLDFLDIHNRILETFDRDVAQSFIVLADI